MRHRTIQDLNDGFGYRKGKQDRHQGGRNSENKQLETPAEQRSFPVDLRIQGVSQEAIYRDTDRMTRIQSLVDKLQAGHHTKSRFMDRIR